MENDKDRFTLTDEDFAQCEVIKKKDREDLEQDVGLDDQPDAG